MSDKQQVQNMFIVDREMTFVRNFFGTTQIPLANSLEWANKIEAFQSTLARATEAPHEIIELCFDQEMQRHQRLWEVMHYDQTVEQIPLAIYESLSKVVSHTIINYSQLYIDFLVSRYYGESNETEKVTILHILSSICDERVTKLLRTLTIDEIVKLEGEYNKRWNFEENSNQGTARKFLDTLHYRQETCY